MAAGIGCELVCLVPGTSADSLTEEIRAVCREAVDEAERRLLAILLGDHLPSRERRSREPELVRVLGLDRIIAERTAAACRP